MTREEAIELLDNASDNLIGIVLNRLDVEGFFDLSTSLRSHAENKGLFDVVSEQQVPEINRFLFRQLARIPNTLSLRNLLTGSSHPIDWLIDFEVDILPGLRQFILR